LINTRGKALERLQCADTKEKEEYLHEDNRQGVATDKRCW
jgi:hypothetical protein